MVIFARIWKLFWSSFMLERAGKKIDSTSPVIFIGVVEDRITSLKSNVEHNFKKIPNWKQSLCWGAGPRDTTSKRCTTSYRIVEGATEKGNTI